MRFNKHSELEGSHAFLSASKHSWINYSDDKLDLTFQNSMLAQRGTELHELASSLIKLGVKLPRSNKTLNSFVNDAIGYRMQSEQILFYSYNAFGTADAISFRNNLLRIYDLKTGITKASEHQLWIYAAFFCLEYGYQPRDIQMQLRIYQNNEIFEFIPDPKDIEAVMKTIVRFDERINQMRMEALA